MNTKPTAPETGLYMRCDTAEAMRLFPKLREVFMVMNGSDHEKNMHVIEIVLSGKEEQDIEAATLYVQVAQSNGVVALVQGDIEFAKTAQADGVVVTGLRHVASARDTLGEEAIVAVMNVSSLGEAIAARSAGADLIGIKPDAFGLADIKLLAELADGGEHPVLAQGAYTNDNVHDAVMMGATFVDCTEYLFGYEKGSAQAASNMLYAVELAGSAQLN